SNPLRPVTKLSKVFSELPQDEHLHIVVLNPVLKLRYWVIGEGRVFSMNIDINKNQLVEDLRLTIMENQGSLLKDIRVADLKLWKASIPYEDEDSLNIERRAKEIMNGETLLETKKCSDIFKLSPNKRHINAVVWYPRRLKLWCWFIMDNPAHKLQVEVNPNDDVQDLKRAIMSADPSFKDVSLRTLQLWKASVPFTDMQFDQKFMQHVREIMNNRMLAHGERISEAFAEPPREGYLHVIGSYPAKGSATLLCYSGRASFLEAHASRSPSAASSIAGRNDIRALESVQKNQQIAVLYGRPRSAHGPIPVTLLHPILAQFTQDCICHEPTTQDNQAALALMTAMPEFFEDEAGRLEGFTAILETHYGINLAKTEIAQYKSDGHVDVFGAKTLIVEVKAEFGSTNSEAYIEACLYYLEAGRRYFKGKDRLNDSMRLPCILMILAGPYISFSIAAWQDRPVIQPITPMFPLHCHNRDVEMSSSIARSLGAMKKAVDALQDHYMHNEEDYGLPHSIFPYANRFVSLQDSQTHTLDYCVPELDDEVAYFNVLQKSLIFRAKLSGTAEDVCVKFVRRYSRDAHEILAKMGVAPKLYGFEILNAGWIMVVMANVPSHYVSLDLVENRAQYRHLHDIIKQKVELLHQKGFVHGDLRDANVMVPRDRVDHTFLLLDFDWSGRLGQTRYPMNVIHGHGLWRPKDAVDGQLIKAEHDIMMLTAMFLGGGDDAII
ncbi:hypothetical protein AX14_005068, partial [Amanita brunnescens Koide BX004]